MSYIDYKRKTEFGWKNTRLTTSPGLVGHRLVSSCWDEPSVDYYPPVLYKMASASSIDKPCSTACAPLAAR
jgi:hypothetical protein